MDEKRRIDVASFNEEQISVPVRNAEKLEVLHLIGVSVYGIMFVREDVVATTK